MNLIRSLSQHLSSLPLQPPRVLLLPFSSHGGDLKATMGSLYSLILILTVFSTAVTPLSGVSTPPVFTIHSPDGDTIDCINREDQPAFHHPLLRDHKIQEFPTGMPHLEEKSRKKWQVWHETGKECPVDTIPILRPKRDSSSTYYKKHRQHPKETGDQYTAGHMYGAVRTVGKQKYYGTKAILNVWDPLVEAPGDFSLAQIWLSSGSYETKDLNTIEVGWQVWPSEYKDNQPRLFTYWTAAAYKNHSGCYNVECPGFVQTSNTTVLGGAISPTSTFDGTQRTITIHIWKDSSSGNWWLALDDRTVGYWPGSIFHRLSSYATRVVWGGEVVYTNSSGRITKAQMGSGEFANKGWGKAAFVCNLEVAANNNTFLPLQEFEVLETNPEYFTVEKGHNKECVNHFYYGGPGPLLSLRSEASGESYSVATLITSFILLLLISV